MDTARPANSDVILLLYRGCPLSVIKLYCHDPVGARELILNKEEGQVYYKNNISFVATEPVIVSQASATDDCGKGTVTDAILGEAKTAVCRIQAP